MLLGHPVAHSLSPAIQNAALRSAGIPLTYEAIDVPPGALVARLEACVAEHAAGNVTVPYKERVAAACARRSAVAERVGAVNVFWVEHEALVGDNTDVPGFQEAVVALLGAVPTDARVALLGAGGSAAAVVVAAAGWPGARVRVWGRSPGRAAALCARFPALASMAASATGAVCDATIVINATPVGLRDDTYPLDPTELPTGAAVVDLAYRPGETAWVRAARARGHRACDGLPMLVAQGALAFERWFGIAADREAMWSAARSTVAEALHASAQPD